MKIDLHCHSKYSFDNYFDPSALIKEAIANGLDGVCITEHYSIDASQPYEKLTIPTGFLLLRAAEISPDIGHLLI